MALHRRAAKRDLSEAVIFLALRQAGFCVQPVSVKDGPDAWISKGGHERAVKTGKAKLRPGQREWHETWQGAALAAGEGG